MSALPESRRRRWPVAAALLLALGACSSEPAADGRLELVAIGDSIGAGVPLGELDITRNGSRWVVDERAPGDRSEGARQCQRSELAWPVLLADELAADATVLACTGATVHNGVLGPQGGLAPQVEGIGPSTDLVTLSIGANDIDLLGRIRSCYLTLGACTSTDERRRLDAALDGFRTDLREVVDQVQRRAPDARVLLMTYYDPLPPAAQVGDRCFEASFLAGLIELDADEAAWLGDALRRFNDVLRDVAADTEVVLVDIEEAFTGHQLCDSEPWAYGPSILVQPGRQDSQAPLHPTPEGQAAIARAAAAALERALDDR